MIRTGLKIAVVGAILLAVAAPGYALDGPGAPKSMAKQSPGNYVKMFLKPSKTEDDVDLGVAVLPGKAAWALKTTTYFGLWYFFNIFYNVANKKTLNALSLPWLQSLACVGIGIPYIALMWALGVRKAPNLTTKQIKSLFPLVSLHSAGNVGGNMAFGAGSLGFAHVLKAMEPAFTAVFSGVINGKWAHPMVYATLVPIMGGVAYASAGEVSFNMLQFVSAMVSNVGFSLRAVLGKNIMSDKAWDRKITNLDGPNTFSVLQLGSTLVTLPFVIAMEGWRAVLPWMHPNWKAAIGKLDHAGTMITPGYLSWQLFMSGIMFQLYYEAAFLALDAVSPVTHSIGNNIKRVVIVVTSVIIFGQKMSTQAQIGSSVAIGGVFLYSYAQEHFAALAKKAAK